MPAHIHAALMAEYAKDALETDKPWERWERQPRGSNIWTNCTCTPDWAPTTQYRRKRSPLCRIEGRDVFAGDKLWHVEFGWVIAQAKAENPNLLFTLRHSVVSLRNLAWAEPSRTKTVYQWAILRPNESRWFVSDWLYSTEQEAARNSGDSTAKFRRLDWTALEVPA